MNNSKWGRGAMPLQEQAQRLDQLITRFADSPSGIDSVSTRVHSKSLSTSFKHSIGHSCQRRASFGPQNPSEYAACAQSVPEGV